MGNLIYQNRLPILINANIYKIGGSMFKRKFITLMLIVMLVIAMTGCNTLIRAVRITDSVLSAAILGFDMPTIYPDIIHVWDTVDGALAVAEVLTDAPAAGEAYKPKAGYKILSVEEIITDNFTATEVLTNAPAAGEAELMVDYDLEGKICASEEEMSFDAILFTYN
jgi:hypothetical protein